MGEAWCLINLVDDASDWVAQYKVSRTLGNLKNELRLDQVELDERSKDLKNEITLEDKVLIANYVNCFFLNHDD